MAAASLNDEIQPEHQTAVSVVWCLSLFSRLDARSEPKSEESRFSLNLITFEFLTLWKHFTNPVKSEWMCFQLNRHLCGNSETNDLSHVFLFVFHRHLRVFMSPELVWTLDHISWRPPAAVTQLRSVVSVFKLLWDLSALMICMKTFKKKKNSVSCFFVVLQI